ncbi:MAG: phosphatidate cytidylyltransferase [Alphaproteobacteria bacterium]|nr:phosphatidate cytidylyltransferase [Alphaproteobacteria bacterium]
MPLLSALRRFNTTNLRLRLISSAILAPLTVLAVFLGGKIYCAVVACALTIGLYEWIRLVSPKALDRLTGIACASLVALLGVAALLSMATAAALGIVLVPAIYLLARYERADAPGLIALGLPYMGGSGLALLGLRSAPENGVGLVFYLLSVVWATDVGAYLVGSTLGGKKLAPTISPGKTWAGLFGGVAIATAVGYAAAIAFGAQVPSFALVLSPILALVSQAGDLFESYTKRRAGVKESGDLIPGHGGILDRIDGLVFAAMFAYLFQISLGDRILWW